jgi:hypothetical protein
MCNSLKLSCLLSFSSPEPFSLGHSLKIRLWVRRLKGEIWLASQRTAISQKFRSAKLFYQHMSTNTSFLRNTSLWKLLRMLKRPNSRACALEFTASLLALPVSCVPGPREDACGREALGTRMVFCVLHLNQPLRFVGIHRHPLHRSANLVRHNQMENSLYYLKLISRNSLVIHAICI